MKWLATSRTVKSTVITIMLISCGASCGNEAAGQVNRPLAQADVVRSGDLARVDQIVRAFARKNRFAVQETPTPSQGLLEFNLRLFRDDISLSVSKLHGDPIGVSAYPLCACELGQRIGLQAAADAAVQELKNDLSRE